MGAFTILEVVTGLALVYLLLSLLSSIVTEMISGRLSWRPNMLKRGVDRLVGQKLSDKIFKHGLVCGMTDKKQAPSYLSSETFARALFDVLLEARPEKKLTVGDLAVAFAAVEHEPARQALLSFLQHEEVSVDSIRDAVKDWYDDAMDRVSGWYKRKAQALAALVSLGVCVVFNADTLHLAKELWNDPDTRSAITEHAQMALEDCQREQVSLNECDRWSDHKKIQADLHGLPLGWDGMPEGIWGWILKVVGWFLTTAALSLGGPFWFDVLNKVVNLRNAGKKPERSSDK